MKYEISKLQSILHDCLCGKTWALGYLSASLLHQSTSINTNQHQSTMNQQSITINHLVLPPKFTTRGFRSSTDSTDSSKDLRGHGHLVLQVHARHLDPRLRRGAQEHGGHDPGAEAQVEDGGTWPARLAKGLQNLENIWEKSGKIWEKSRKV